MRIYIVAGEVSGDVHAANLLNALQQKNPGIRFRGIGGDNMVARGLDVFAHIKKLSFMGLTEVLQNIFTIRDLMRQTKADILQWKPDAIILVDYPGFNLQLARFAKAHGIPCIYYISPKIWAWRQSRANQIKRYVDLMLCILPFEKEFYQRFNYEVTYVGNPVLDAINDYVPDETFLYTLQKNNKPLVAILPGSRKQEIAQCLPVMLQVTQNFPQYKFVIAALENTHQQILSLNNTSADVVCNRTYELLSVSRAAMVTSGTATLETALFRVPQVCCYKTSGLTYFAAKQFIRVPFISLVNLIAGKAVIKELIQASFNEDALRRELHLLTADDAYRISMLAGYDTLINILGRAGASEQAATAIMAYLRKQ
jgi:lipid-A-disaccharide synthase